ncbi:hypothetical protein ACFOYW_08665 [Gryllotalpicola reticulitermitis]|uniref:Uncharacterized protein n=1 Tax=Gryllotalpicola reticulitermitis TaxID=1184153 RepID=A0ABV8Q8E7_9MICO
MARTRRRARELPFLALVVTSAMAALIGLAGCASGDSLPVHPGGAPAPAPAYTLKPMHGTFASTCGGDLALIVAGRAPAIDAPLGCGGGLVVGSYSPVEVQAVAGDHIDSWVDDRNGYGSRFTGTLWSSSPRVVRADGADLVAVGPGTALVAVSTKALFVCNPAGGGSIAPTSCTLWRVVVG